MASILQYGPDGLGGPGGAGVVVSPPGHSGHNVVPGADGGKKEGTLLRGVGHADGDTQGPGLLPHGAVDLPAVGGSHGQLRPGQIAGGVGPPLPLYAPVQGFTSGGDDGDLRAKPGEYLRPTAGHRAAADDHRPFPHQVNEQREPQVFLSRHNPPGLGGGVYLDLGGAPLQILRGQVVLQTAGEQIHRPAHRQLHQFPGLRALQIGGQHPGGHRLFHPLQAGQAILVVLPLVQPVQILFHNSRHLRWKFPAGLHPQIVHIVEGKAGQGSHLGLDVPGDGQVGQYPGRPGQLGQLPGRHGVVGAGGGGEYQIHPLHRFITGLVGGDGAAGGYHRLPVVVAAQRHRDGAPRLVKEGGGQTAHLPIADDQGLSAFQAAQMGAQLVHRRPGCRTGHADEAHLGFNLLTGGGGIAEQGLQHSVRCARLPGGLNCPLHLGDDLILPPDLGAQAASHLHQVAGRLLPRPGDKGGLKGAVLHPRLIAQQPPGVGQRPLPAGQVQLGAVAGGQQHAARHPFPAGQAAVQLQHLVAGKGQLFPQVDGGAVPVQAGHNELHACPPFFTSTTEK